MSPVYASIVLLGPSIFKGNSILKKQYYVLILIIIVIFGSFIILGLKRGKTSYHSFVDYPGFKEYYEKSCGKGEPASIVSETEKKLLSKYRPRLILPPGGRYPIDFYEEYIPYTVMRRFPETTIVVDKVTPEILAAFQEDKKVYLDFQFDRYRKAGLDRRVGNSNQLNSKKRKLPVVYGRFYQERVDFPDEKGKFHSRDFTFLKYNVVFAFSGLPAIIFPEGFETLLIIIGLGPDNWHELDNFVAIHVVLDEREKPVAVILAQHNHHRTFLIGKEIFFPSNGRMIFDIALRSNEIYPASDNEDPVKHRVIQWSLYFKYLLSGEDPPFFKGFDVTYGIKAGGVEMPYKLAFLSPCDPLYTAKIMLGEPRPFMGRYIGRDGPPGSDYYTIPSLLPLGNLLKFSYLHDYDPDDIRMVEKSIDLNKKEINVKRLMEYGGRSFYKDLKR